MTWTIMGSSTSTISTTVGKKSTAKDVLENFGIGKDSLSGTVAVITGGHSGDNSLCLLMIWWSLLQWCWQDIH